MLSRRDGRGPATHVLAVIACVGVLWGPAEYVIHYEADALGIDLVLVSYGRIGTVLNLLSNLAGAALVVLFGDRILTNLILPREDQACSFPQPPRIVPRIGH